MFQTVGVSILDAPASLDGAITLELRCNRTYHQPKCCINNQLACGTGANIGSLPFRRRTVSFHGVVLSLEAPERGVALSWESDRAPDTKENAVTEGPRLLYHTFSEVYSFEHRCVIILFFLSSQLLSYTLFGLFPQPLQAVILFGKAQVHTALLFLVAIFLLYQLLELQPS